MNVLIFILCLPAVLPASVLPTAPTTCFYNHKTYNDGDHFKPDACTYCNCDHGRTSCMVADCFFTPCVDSVRKPDQCCPTCPNGHNCHGPNGQIIAGGQSVKVDEYTTCECPALGRGNFAVCRMSKPTPLFS